MHTLYDGHVQKRINVNRCHLNPHHDHAKLVEAEAQGACIVCLRVHSAFTEFARILFDILYVVYSRRT